mgnify:CR=1 FL=1
MQPSPLLTASNQLFFLPACPSSDAPASPRRDSVLLLPSRCSLHDYDSDYTFARDHRAAWQDEWYDAAPHTPPGEVGAKYKRCGRVAGTLAGLHCVALLGCCSS